MGMTNNDMGFVYLLKSGDFYKIGMTRGTVENRLRSLQTGSPHPIEVIHTIEVANLNEWEAYLHELYKHKHHHGEWYALDAQDVALITHLRSVPEFVDNDVSIPRTESVPSFPISSPEEIHYIHLEAHAIQIVCPKCRTQNPQQVTTTQSRYNFQCPKCKTKFRSRYARIRAKRSRGEKKSNRRHFSVRVQEADGSETLLEFTNSKYEDFELRANDIAVFSYVNGKLKIVENKTIGLYWRVSQSDCYIATYLFGEVSHETEVLRWFRDERLLFSPILSQFVSIYYFLSPKMVKRFGNNELFRLVCSIIVGPIIWYADKIRD